MQRHDAGSSGGVSGRGQPHVQLYNESHGGRNLFNTTDHLGHTSVKLGVKLPQRLGRGVNAVSSPQAMYTQPTYLIFKDLSERARREGERESDNPNIARFGGIVNAFKVDKILSVDHCKCPLRVPVGS